MAIDQKSANIIPFARLSEKLRRRAIDDFETYVQQREAQAGATTRRKRVRIEATKRGTVAGKGAAPRRWKKEARERVAHCRDTATTDADAALIAAEIEIARIGAEYDAEYNGSEKQTSDFNGAFAAIDEFIANTPPATLKGAAVKVRRLLDPEGALNDACDEGLLVSLAQVLTLLDEMAGAPTHPTRPTLARGTED